MSQTDEDVEDLPLDSVSEGNTEQTQHTGDEQDPEQMDLEIQGGEEAGGEYQEGEHLEGEEEEQEVETEETAKKKADSETEIMTVDADMLGEGEGEGEEEMEQEEMEEEEPDYYDPDDFISGAKLCKGGTLPMDILMFDFSYGYDCRKYFNLTVLDDKMLVFASGNFINFFNVETREIYFRRSALGGGIGHIKKNPKPEYPYFAIAECGGRRPLIIMYEWPEMEIHCIMKGGSAKLYSNLDFSPDGEQLVSQGGEPDYLITIWNWKEHKIVLRAKSYISEIYTVKFSPYVPGQLTTCGMSHIKFWKMAITFTGLKLKGELGRFGKTEYSDIFGVLPMPDEKVLSGCNWGNILVWDAGLISLEVYRSMRKTCHDGPIVQMYYEDEELWTVSMDGHVRVWWYEHIDQADPPDDDRVVLLDPSYDFYTPGVMLMSINKRRPHDPSDTFYYGQDGNGGIWLIDLNTEEEPKPSVQLYKSHAGAVTDLAPCPHNHYFASIGGNSIFIYNYLEQRRIYEYDMQAKGTCMLWLPLEIVRFGDVILAGCDDGQIRVCVLRFGNDNEITMCLTQVIKPHNRPVTAISVNNSGTILVSGGEDSTIFIFKLDTNEYSENFLIPIGFIPSPDIVTCITWHYELDAVVLVGCLHGKMMEVEVPYDVQPYTGISFLLDLSPTLNQFKTYKAQIRRDIKVREIEDRKAKKLAKKQEELDKVKKDNPGLEVDEEAFLADSESEEELEPLHIPEVPNKILWLRYTTDKTIWLSMGGFDAGYIYEYLIDQKDDIPIRFKMIHDADDIEISSYVYSKNKEYLIFAMQDGTMRVNKVNPEDFRDLTDYWTLSMHDNQNGFVPKMCFSCDEHYFFSCGHDGNVFGYKFQPDDFAYSEIPYARYRSSRPFHVKDLEPYTKLSLEETKIKAENDRVLKLANQRKAKVREILKNLKQRYARVLTRNAKLLSSQVIPREELELDARVSEEIEKGLDDKLQLVKRKLAYDVEKSAVQMRKLLGHFTDSVDIHPITLKAINNDELELISVRQNQVDPKFYEMLDYVNQRVIAEQSKGRPPERVFHHRLQLAAKAAKSSALEYFLLSLSPSVIQHSLGPKLTRLLNKYRERMDKWDRRLEEWEQFIAKKPVEGKNHPDDEKLLTEAKDTIGDYKLKESDDYKVPHDQKDTTVKKYKQVLEARLKQYHLRHEFSKAVWKLRNEKYVVIDHLKEKRDLILKINEELPKNLRNLGPDVPEVNEKEFPEKKITPNIVIPEQSVFEDASMEELEFVESPDLDAQEREFIPETGFPILEDITFRSTIDQRIINEVSDLDIRDLLNYPEDKDTPYEMDVKARRLTRKLYTQSQIINAMNEEINNFNKQIDVMKEQRLPIQVKGNYIDLYILTLNQELTILKLSEDIEDRFTDKVNDNLRIVHGMEDILDGLNHKMATHKLEIENCQVEATKIQDRFRHATENNKFYDFLRKVFKKKYKAPKIRGDDESSSSSSSSSSSESGDDAASQDSEDFTIIKQDLNVCPKGCEQAIFNLTIDLRTQRHRYEQTEIEQNRMIEIVKKDINLNVRKGLMLKKNLQQSTDELEAFQREKQRKLNQVTCTVLMKLDQICGFNSETSEITDFLVFPRETLTKLYNRVGVLQVETFEQRGKHDTYLKHLMRMHKDMGYMRKKIKELEQEQSDQMRVKFGKVVDIMEIDEAMLKRSFKKTQVNELEEVMLKKLVYELRIKSTDVKDIYANELKDWMGKIRYSQKDLLEVIQENTKRLDLLKVLNKEKKELAELISLQPSKKEHMEKLEKASRNCLMDITRLEEIAEKQCEELYELKAEIKMLKTKGLPPKPPREAVAARESTFDARKWMEHMYMMEEDEEKPYDITAPGYYTESQDVIAGLITGLMETLETQLERKSTENMTKNILSGILKCVSVTEIINEILNYIPFEPDDDQRTLIESTAEKLYQIQEPEMTPVTIEKYTADLLEDIIDEVMLTKGEPHDVIFRLVKKLVYAVPFDYLNQKGSLDGLISRLTSSIGSQELSKEGLAKAVDSIPSIYRDQMTAVLDIILERVYGIGMDYLYVIKY